MSDEVRGIAGDRRRNPFPSLNDTEYELLMEKIEGAAERGAQRAVGAYMKSCEGHLARTDHIEATVFGRAEANVVGMDERLRSVERSLGYAAKALWIAIGACIISVVGVIFGR